MAPSINSVGTAVGDGDTGNVRPPSRVPEGRTLANIAPTSPWRVADPPVLRGGTDPMSSSSIATACNRAGQAAGDTGNDPIGRHAAP